MRTTQVNKNRSFRREAVRPMVALRDYLKDLFGITTNQDLYAYVGANRTGTESNYDVLVRKMGENVAIKVMSRLASIECI